MSVGLLLSEWDCVSLPGPFGWTDGLVKILSIWFGLGLQLETNWSEVRKEIE